MGSLEIKLMEMLNINRDIWHCWEWLVKMGTASHFPWSCRLECGLQGTAWQKTFVSQLLYPRLILWCASSQTCSAFKHSHVQVLLVISQLSNRFGVLSSPIHMQYLQWCVWLRKALLMSHLDKDHSTAASYREFCHELLCLAEIWWVLWEDCAPSNLAAAELCRNQVSLLV